MGTWLWALVLLTAVWVAHWGAEHLAEPLKRMRRQWGVAGAAGRWTATGRAERGHGPGAPVLGILALVARLTLPAAWRGLTAAGRVDPPRRLPPLPRPGGVSWEG